MIDYTDIFLYDIKIFDEQKHKEYTGVSNKIILDNIKYINSLSKEIEVRIPLIPHINTDHENIIQTGEFLSELKMVKKVKLLAYNNLANSKYDAVGRISTMPNVEPPTEKTMRGIEEKLGKYHFEVVR